MKKNIVLLLLTISCVSLMGCKASSINRIVNTIGEEAGVDVNLNLKQEDVDKVVDGVNDVKDKVVDIVTDTEVQQSLKDLANAVENAATETTE